MNTAARALQQTTYLEGRIGGLLLSSRMVKVLAVLLLVLASAFAVVYEREVYRHYTANLQQLQQANFQARIESKQLLLEQSTWAQQARIQQIAQEQLHMAMAETANIVMVSS